MEAPIIAGIDNRKEYFTKLPFSKPRNIPIDRVMPLLEILENMDNPCPIPIQKASEFPSFLSALFRNLVINTRIPVTIKPIAYSLGVMKRIFKKRLECYSYCCSRNHANDD